MYGILSIAFDLSLDLIECGPYVTGANFSGFKAILPKLVDLSFPIAEIDPDGTCVITKCQQHAGAVTKHNTIAQFLYELQGEQYLNSDVLANLHNIQIEEIGSDRIRVCGITGNPPPETTKAIIAAPGGYQAEATFYINGLDVAEKAEMMRNQLSHIFRDNNFSKLSIELYGSPSADPRSQQEGTVSLRVFAQARRLEDIAAPKFKIPIYALRMQSYPGMEILVKLYHIKIVTSLTLPHFSRLSYEPRFPDDGPKAIHGDISRFDQFEPPQPPS